MLSPAKALLGQGEAWPIASAVWSRSTLVDAAPAGGIAESCDWRHRSAASPRSWTRICLSQKTNLPGEPSSRWKTKKLVFTCGGRFPKTSPPSRACSSVDRALRSQRRGRRFDPDQVHQEAVKGSPSSRGRLSSKLVQGSLIRLPTERSGQATSTNGQVVDGRSAGAATEWFC